jgi:hypothetical protein
MEPYAHKMIPMEPYGYYTTEWNPMEPYARKMTPMEPYGHYTT